MLSTSWCVILGLLFVLEVQCAETDNESCIKDTIPGWQENLIWTEWMSLKSPNDEMFYDLDQLLSKYPNCEVTSNDQIRHRKKYLPFLGSSKSQPEFMPGKGIYCKNEKNNNAQCTDYEVRFQCVANEPIPDFHWDLSGKESYQSMDFEVCTLSKSNHIYSLKGGRTALVHGNLYLRNSYPKSEYMCALYYNGSTVIDFGDFNGTCVSKPSRCVNGFSVSLWIITTQSGSILKSPESRRPKRDGFSIRVDNGTLTVYMQSCHHGVNATLNESLPSGWNHVVTTFHPHNQSQIQIFINGDERGELIRDSYISTNTESASLVSGAYTSGFNDQREFGLSNVKIFNHKLSTEEVKNLHIVDTDLSSLEVLRLQDVSISADTIDLQCIVKTCYDPEVKWLYYPHGSTVSNPTASTLVGKTARKSKCHIEYVLQGKHQAGFFVCEASIDDGSYAYKVIEVNSTEVSTSTSTDSTNAITTGNDTDTITTIREEFITASEEYLITETRRDDITPPVGGESAELSSFIAGIPRSCQETVRDELNFFKQMTLNRMDVKMLQPNEVGYQFEHNLLRQKKKGPKKNRRKPETGERKLVGKVTMPNSVMTSEGFKGNITVAVAYGRVESKENEANITTSSKRVAGAIDDGILFIWVFADESETSAQVDFIVPKTEAKQKSHDVHYCGFWDDEIRMWSTKGCKTHEDAKSVSCNCDHTTSFAIILQVVDVEVPYWLKLLSKLLGSVSICCLLLTICIFIMLRPAKNYRIIIHGNLAASLALAQLVFMTLSDATKYQTLCQVGALLSHYFFTSFLFWMLIEGYLLYQKSVTPTKNPPRIKILLFFGWGIPCAVVGISFALQQDAYGAIYRPPFTVVVVGPIGRSTQSPSCWLDSKVLQWIFVSQAIVVVSINALVLIVVMKTFASLHVNVNKSEFERTKSNTRALCALVPVLGMTWTFGLLAIGTSPEITIRMTIFMILFDVTNCLQGVFILIFHCLKNREIQKEFDVRKKVARSRRSSRSSSSNNQLIRCRTTTGDLLYIPGDLIEKSSPRQSPRHSPTREYQRKFPSVASPERTSDAQFSF